MMKIRTVFRCILFLLTFYFSGLSQFDIEREAIISVDRIWNRAQHNAFTSLIIHNDNFYIAFREGAGHVSYINGSIRVLSSEDGQNWSSVALLDLEGVDLRDAQLSVTPDNRIMLNIGGSVYKGNNRVSMSPVVSFSDKNGTNFSKPSSVSLDAKIKTNDDWLWKVTWHKGIAYGTVYQVNEKGTVLQLVKSTDGINYEYITTFDLSGNPNEATLLFTPDDKMIALIRRGGGNSHGYIGISEYPYTQWELNELGVRLGGPNLILLPNQKLLCGTREYPLDFKEKMIVGLVNKTGYFRKLVTLPSGGDCSYPGMIIRDDVLYVSYYSSHEEKTAIYFAKLRLNKILELTDKNIAPKPQLVKNMTGGVELNSELENSTIIYTLDGSVPSGQNGIKYNDPIKIDITTTLRAVTLCDNYLASDIATFIIGHDVYQEALQIDKEYRPGLNFKYFEGEFSQVKDLSTSSISNFGIIDKVSILQSPKKINFGYKYYGYIKVPKDGLYTFYLESNDGSVFKLNENILINNDGSHGRREIEQPVSLRKGMHKIHINYFQMGGGAFLKLSWKSKDFEKKEIPADLLFH